MGVSIALLSILALGGFGVYFGLKTIENYRPGRKKIQRDLQKIRAEMQPYIADLVPWTREEMEQLSMNQVNRSSKKGVVKTQRGVFTTIYHEPIIAWTYRKYVSSKENALIYAKTSHHEFIYRIKKGLIEIVVDDHLIGRMDEQGNLFPVKGNKALAQVNRSTEALSLPVIVNGREVGSLTNPNQVSRANPRAFQLIGPMEKEEEVVFLSLSILEMIRNKI